MASLPKDPIMLLSVINTALRDHYKSLDDLADDYGINKSEIVDKLSAVNYIYDASTNQFK